MSQLNEQKASEELKVKLTQKYEDWFDKTRMLLRLTPDQLKTRGFSSMEEAIRFTFKTIDKEHEKLIINFEKEYK